MFTYAEYKSSERMGMWKNIEATIQNLLIVPNHRCIFDGFFVSDLADVFAFDSAPFGVMTARRDHGRPESGEILC